MKKLLYLVVVFAAVSCSNELTMNRKTFNLNGDVKLITETRSEGVYDRNWNVYPMINDTTFRAEQETYYFDENGILTHSELKDMTGKLISKTEILYTEDGNFEGSKKFDSHGNLIETCVVKQLSEEELKMETKDASGNTLNSITEKYESGLLKNKKIKWNNQLKEEESAYSRNEDGNETEIKNIVTNNEHASKKTVEVTMKVKNLSTDTYDNWTRRALYNKKNNKCIIIDRKVVYYE